MDYRSTALDLLHNHMAGLVVAVLPPFLLGATPVSPDLLTAAITTEVANNHGTVLSPRVITGLTSGKAFLCSGAATTMMQTTLAPFILASGAGVLVDLRHMVSQNRKPPNDIRLTTYTL